MRKLILFALGLGFVALAQADTTVSVPAITTVTGQPDPISSITSNFTVALLDHVTASDEFTTSGDRKIEFTDGIIGAIPYKGDNVIVGDVGIIPNLNDPTSFYKTYGIHLHLVQLVSQYLNYNPTYASILQSVELDPRYSYDTDVHHGVLGVTLGYVKHF